MACFCERCDYFCFKNGQLGIRTGNRLLLLFLKIFGFYQLFVNLRNKSGNFLGIPKISKIESIYIYTHIKENHITQILNTGKTSYLTNKFDFVRKHVKRQEQRLVRDQIYEHQQ